MAEFANTTNVTTFAELASTPGNTPFAFCVENSFLYFWNPTTAEWVEFLNASGVTDEIATAIAGVGGSQLPVGFILTTTNSANPATYLGYGTWSAFAQGRMLVGVDTGDPDFDTAGETGGSKTVTLTEAQLPAHTHSVTDPGHTHVENQNSATTGPNAGWGARDTSTNTSVATGYSTASSTTGITLGNTGSGEAHDNMPPFVAVYMFQRTA